MLIGFITNAQDQIIKKDGSELNVEITEISDTILKYKKKGLSVAFSLDLSEVLLVTFKNGERMTFADVKSSKKGDVETVLLTAGTRIAVVMTETISSDKKGGRQVETGEVIALRVQADVSDIDGNILVKQGTLVNGTITQSVKRKAAGTKGKLSFSVDYIKSIDGQSVPVNLKYDFAGKSKTGVAVATGALVAAPLLLIKGKPAIIKEGQVFNALVVGDKKIKIQD
ncbi:hypothetical protein OAN39_02990 [Flavobacteriaceae bacterium]|nr:hypothetical protein [Flavobacteriaceae bacterium]